MKTFIIIALLLASSMALRKYKTPFEQEEQGETSNEGTNTFANPPEQWFDQKLDHFSPLDNRTWEQRYFVMNHWFNATANPAVILYICGEGECNNLSYNSSFMATIAQNFNGIVFSLEHRFYGKSQPFGYSNSSYSLENLKYLTSQQALSDLAWFIQYAKDNNLFGIDGSMPWVTIGGSYPGALSAWFRYKFPHLTVGALASSAVVNSIVDFYEFDQEISVALSKQKGNSSNCRKVVHDVNVNVTLAFKFGKPEEVKAIKEIFTKDTEISDGDFLFFFSDITVMGVQYGDRENMCDLITSDLSFYGVLRNIAKYAKQIQCTTDEYDVKSLRKTAYGHSLNARQWYYQVCSEFGWLFTPAHQYPMRSTLLNMEYWTNWCSLAYDGAFPASAETNNYYGGVGLEATNLIFTNGGEDPWQWASKRTSSKGMQSYIADCNQCAHCVDLETPSPNDSLVLKAIHKQILSSFSKWINHHYASNSSESNSFVEEMIKSLAE